MIMHRALDLLYITTTTTPVSGACGFQVCFLYMHCGESGANCYNLCIIELEIMHENLISLLLYFFLAIKQQGGGKCRNGFIKQQEKPPREFDPLRHNYSLIALVALLR
jgi:hypothetical protein